MKSITIEIRPTPEQSAAIEAFLQAQGIGYRVEKCEPVEEGGEVVWERVATWVPAEQ